MKGSVRSDSDVGQGHVVVDRAYSANNLEMRMACGLLFCDLATGTQIADEVWPL